MEQENLNLEEHRKDLILKALNRKPNYKQAAIALGISKPTLRRDILRFNIWKMNNIYQIVNVKKGK